nr:reverse transcriptase domain-containing protein [Tanacetum cinerariifolium]
MVTRAFNIMNSMSMEILSCNPKDYDGKGGAIAYTCWIEKMKSTQDISGCGDNQKEATVGMTWEDFKALMREEFYLNNKMQKLETEFWCHVVVRAGHVAYTNRFHELSRLVLHLVTPKNKRIERNGYLKKNTEKRGNGGEPSRDGNVNDNNKRSRTGRAFATTTNPVRKEYKSSAPKCTNYNFHHHPEIPCRTYGGDDPTVKQVSKRAKWDMMTMFAEGWGCRAVVRLPDPKLKTLNERDIKCIFVGYAECSKVLVVIKEVTEEVVQQPELKLGKSKRNRNPKNFGAEFQLYLIEETRDEYLRYMLKESTQRLSEILRIIGAGVEPLEPGFELDDQEWVEIGIFFEQMISDINGYRGRVGDEFEGRDAHGFLYPFRVLEAKGDQ